MIARDLALALPTETTWSLDGYPFFLEALGGGPFSTLTSLQPMVVSTHRAIVFLKLFLSSHLTTSPLFSIYVVRGTAQ